MSPSPYDARRLVELLAADDPRAADELDDLARRLHAAADAVRARHADPFAAPGGFGDRVRMEVRGPSGELKQSFDSNGGT